MADDCGPANSELVMVRSLRRREVHAQELSPVVHDDFRANLIGGCRCVEQGCWASTCLSFCSRFTLHWQRGRQE